MAKFIQLEVYNGPEVGDCKSIDSSQVSKVLLNISNLVYASENQDGLATVCISTHKSVIQLLTLTKYTDIIKAIRGS